MVWHASCNGDISGFCSVKVSDAVREWSCMTIDIVDTVLQHVQNGLV